MPTENFDNTVIAFRTLFEMLSTEGWLILMEAGVDGIKPTKDGPMQPQFNN